MRPPRFTRDVFFPGPGAWLYSQGTLPETNYYKQIVNELPTLRLFHRNRSRN
jgi:hypothetical protein